MRKEEENKFNYGLNKAGTQILVKMCNCRWVEESGAQGALWAGFTGGPVILKTVGKAAIRSTI